MGLRITLLWDRRSTCWTLAPFGHAAPVTPEVRFIGLGQIGYGDQGAGPTEISGDVGECAGGVYCAAEVRL